MNLTRLHRNLSFFVCVQNTSVLVNHLHVSLFAIVDIFPLPSPPIDYEQQNISSRAEHSEQYKRLGVCFPTYRHNLTAKIWAFAQSNVSVRTSHHTFSAQ